MKRISFLCVLFLVFSCDNIQVKKVEASDLLNEELKTFNWNEVDTFPTFELCKSASDSIEGKACFENTITQHLLTKLSESNLVASQSLNDTIYLDFIISDSGVIKVEEVKLSDLINQELPEIKDLISQSLEDLPEIFPAIKRGQQVNSQFTLPIIINTD